MTPPPITNDEWWSAVTWYSGFDIGWEDNVDDPEACGVMKPQQKYNQQHRAEASCRIHVSLEPAALRLLEGGRERGREVGPVEALQVSYNQLCIQTVLAPGQQSGYLVCLASFNLRIN